ncbi:hypothetical protein TNCV_2127421 [Trichonephila clavipes]|nr:hypothetical protein TNCV_2127421 [Trichonephila clavipes]
MDTAPANSNSLSTSAAFSSSNQTLFPSTSPMFTALSTVTSHCVPEHTTSHPIAYHLQVHLLYPKPHNLVKEASS